MILSRYALSSLSAKSPIALRCSVSALVQWKNASKSNTSSDHNRAQDAIGPVSEHDRVGLAGMLCDDAICFGVVASSVRLVQRLISRLAVLPSRDKN